MDQQNGSKIGGGLVAWINKTAQKTEAEEFKMKKKIILKQYFIFTISSGSGMFCARDRGEAQDIKFRWEDDWIFENFDMHVLFYKKPALSLVK